MTDMTPNPDDLRRAKALMWEKEEKFIADECKTATGEDLKYAASITALLRRASAALRAPGTLRYPTLPGLVGCLTESAAHQPAAEPTSTA